VKPAMVEKLKKISKETVISNEFGLHARSAAQIANLAGEANYKIWLSKGGELVEATSIMDILMLECPKGTKVQIIIEDPSDLNVLKNISQLIENGFGE
jgi:phosphocarrier protein